MPFLDRFHQKESKNKTLQESIQELDDQISILQKDHLIWIQLQGQFNTVKHLIEINPNQIQRHISHHISYMNNGGLVDQTWLEKYQLRPLIDVLSESENLTTLYENYRKKFEDINNVIQSDLKKKLEKLEAILNLQKEKRTDSPGQKNPTIKYRKG